MRWTAWRQLSANRHCCSDCSLLVGLMYFIHPPLLLRCSELARLGKERLLEGARSRLSEVQGRTALLSPNVQVEPLLLPGAMALLQQVWYSSCCLDDCVLMYSLVVLPHNQQRTPLPLSDMFQSLGSFLSGTQLLSFKPCCSAAWLVNLYLTVHVHCALWTYLCHCTADKAVRPCH